MATYYQDKPGRGQLPNILTEANIKLSDVKLAAATVICKRVYYYWLERGSKTEKLQEFGRKIPETEKIYKQFVQSVRQSESEGELLKMNTIKKLINKRIGNMN